VKQARAAHRIAGARARQAEARLNEIQTELRRSETQAAATLAEKEEALTRTVICAPVDGTIGRRDAEIGMCVGAGTRLLTLGQLDTVDAGANVAG